MLTAALTAAVLAAVPEQRFSAEAQAQQFIDRTRETQATYAVVTANEIHRDDGIIREWAAEFHRGDSHRVETPRDRVVANCRTGWSAHLNLRSGEVSYGDFVSGSVCGIDPTAVVTGQTVTGRRRSSYGLLQQIRVARIDGVRTYEVAPDGAIVGETLINAGGKLRLIEKAISLSNRLPAGNIFSEASLARSVVPDELKSKASQPQN